MPARVLAFLAALLWLLSLEAGAQARPRQAHADLSTTAHGAGALSPRTLTREPDAVTVQGKDIPGADGLAIAGFRLYAHRSGKLGPIPFDLNERDEDGLYVLPSGSSPTKGTGKLGPTSELAFMARDTGDRVGRAALPPGYAHAFEIETVDPKNNRKAWTYLLHFTAGAPAKSPEDYVSLIEVKEPDPMTKKPYVILRSRTFQVRNTEGSTSWYDFHGTKAAGYEEKSFSDHVSVRNRLKIAGVIPFHADEESIYSETPAYYDGAVRLIRRVKLKILVGKIKIPTGIVYDVTAYDGISSVPAKIKIPAAVKAISRDAWASYGLDLNSNAAGKYMFYSNLHPQGIPITGSDKEKSFNFDKKELDPSHSYWSIVTGPYGTVLRRHFTPEDIEKRGVRHYVTFVDDRSKDYAPEYEKGQVGNVLDWLEVQNAPYGEMQFDSYWYTPPHFKYPDDLQEYLDVLDHPLRNTVTELGKAR